MSGLTWEEVEAVWAANPPPGAKAKPDEQLELWDHKPSEL